jgi:sterol desaturase/sphingolipid hydroxylase (fatty acid hydroxylase superfamily)
MQNFFHTDISPIGAHDDPAVGADFHYLHHTFFECNYGVPSIDFDRLFGTYKEYVKKPAGDNKQQN